MGRTNTGTRRSLSVCCVCAIALAGSPALAAEGFTFDFTTLALNYTAVNPNAGAGEVIGAISIHDGADSRAAVQQFHLGLDAAFGGSGGDADVLWDVAKINSPSMFDLLLEAEVVRWGTDDYEIRSTLFGATDMVTTLASPSLGGCVVSDYVTLTPMSFLFAGPLTPLAGRDALLLPEGTDTWMFEGDPVGTPATPNADGLAGRTSLTAGRSAFDSGRFGEFHFGAVGVSSLDEFFSQDRLSLSGDIKVSVVPEPATLALLAVAFLALPRPVRRRK